jgi:hypothetical protein
MRTTTLIALVGTASAAAATLEADCKLADSKTCTAALCWSVDKKFAEVKTYKACKADFDTKLDKCQYGGVCTTSTDA